MDWSDLLNAYLVMLLSMLIHFCYNWYKDGGITDRNWRNLIQNAILAGTIGVVGLLFWVLTEFQ
jgi:hypothetical protein